MKLTPGKQKRGKASKQAIEVFSRGKDTPPAHKALMKSVTDNECVQAMIGDVKVSVAGLAQATQVRLTFTREAKRVENGCPCVACGKCSMTQVNGDGVALCTGMRFLGFCCGTAQ